MQWTFLHPQFWPALLVAALPLVVHLISKRRARELRFGPMEFVLRSQRRSARRIQLRQWLLLVARTLALLALALAIMAPTRRSPDAAAQQGKAPVRHVFALDVTASMDANPGTRRMKAVVGKAAKALDALPPEEPVAVVVCGFAPQALVEPPTFDRAAALGAIEHLRPLLENGDLGACLARASAALSGTTGPARISVFTDAARHAWPQRTRLDLSGISVAIVRPDDEAPFNAAVRALEVRPAPEAGPRAVAVEFEVEAFGANAGAEVEANLVVDGETVARASVKMAGAGPWKKRFTHTLPAATGGAVVHDLAVTIGADALEIDNRLSVPVKAPREVQVLVVDGDPQTVAWRDEVFYAERALKAPPRAGGALNVTVVTQPPGPQDVEAADVVMLVNVRTLPVPTVQALERHVRRGGGLFISGGDRLDVDFYNQSLGALLPQPLRGEKSRVELEGDVKRNVLGIGQVVEEHPIFAPFNGQRPEGLARAQTHTVLLLEPGTRTEREVLMRFSNEAPALVERRVGAGRVLLFTTTLDRDWSDLAIRPGFLPLLQQAVLYLADALDDGRPRHVGVGQTRSIHVRRGAARVVLVAPSGTQHEVPVPQQAGAVETPVLVELGVHRVLMSPSGGELTDVAGERFSVWPPEPESDLVPLTDDEIAARLPDGTSLIGSGSAQDEPDRPLWAILLVLLQLLLVSEGFLARRG